MAVFTAYYTVEVSKSRMFEPYIIGYDESVLPPVPIYRNDVVIPLTMLDGDANSYTATGLEPNTSYYFRMTACNRAGCRSTIIGPYRTDKEMSEGALLDVSYRQDSFTGLTRIWWNQTVVPDRTVVTLQPEHSYGDTRTIIVYGRSYVVEQLAADTYTATIQNFIKTNGSNTLTFEMVIRNHVVCDLAENGEEADAVSGIACSVSLPVSDILSPVDSVVVKSSDNVFLNAADDSFIRDKLRFIGNDVITLEAVGFVTMRDAWNHAASDVVILTHHDVSLLRDEYSRTVSGVVYVEQEERYRLNDAIVPKYRCTEIVPIEHPMLADVSCQTAVDQFYVSEILPLADNSVVQISTDITPSESFWIFDGYGFPDISDRNVMETIYAHDLADSETGIYYDFTHVNGEL